MGRYEDAKTFGEDLPLGHHYVEFSVLEKSGEPMVEDADKGVKATLKLVDKTGDSVLANAYFNAKTYGPIKGMLQCFGVDLAVVDGLITPEDDAKIGETTYPIGLAHKILATCTGKWGWIEIKPREGYKPQAAFRKDEPAVKKTAADYPATAAPKPDGVPI